MSCVSSSVLLKWKFLIYRGNIWVWICIPLIFKIKHFPPLFLDPQGNLSTLLFIEEHFYVDSSFLYYNAWLFLGQTHLPLTDGPSIKCVIKRLFCFSFEFNENWGSCSYLLLCTKKNKFHWIRMKDKNGRPLRAGEFSHRIIWINRSKIVKIVAVLKGVFLKIKYMHYYDIF